MAPYKKTRKVNLLASQRPRSKMRGLSSRQKSKTHFFFLLSFCLKSVWRFSSFLFVILFNQLKKRKRFSYVLSLVLCALVFIKLGMYFVEIYSEKILPGQLYVDTNDPQISQRIRTQVTILLLEAQKKHETRTSFLKSVSTVLNSFDGIDEYWIRLGLDGKLQINATLQIPVILLETKGGDRFVISNRSQIIAKNPGEQMADSLLQVSAPDLKISWAPKNTTLPLSKKINRGKTAPPVRDGNVIPVNLSWLSNQIQLIYSQLQKIDTWGYTLNRMTWSADSGFSLILIKKESLPASVDPSLPQESVNLPTHSFSVFLGQEGVVRKMERLKLFLGEMKEKNLVPSQIDLDYADKATFKIETEKKT